MNKFTTYKNTKVTTPNQTEKNKKKKQKQPVKGKKKKKKKRVIPPGIEPGTLSVLDSRDNRYTTESLRYRLLTFLVLSSAQMYTVPSVLCSYKKVQKNAAKVKCHNIEIAYPWPSSYHACTIMHIHAA